jgi:phospholipase B1
VTLEAPYPNQVLPRRSLVLCKRRGADDSANPLTVWSEYRGLSYPTGLDPGTISIASILSRYTNLTGGSTGHHLPASCPAKVCGLREQDGLNAAISGSVASGLKAQVSGEVFPTAHSER